MIGTHLGVLHLTPPFDNPPAEEAPITPFRDDIASFVRAMFPNAPSGEFVDLRAFPEKGTGSSSARLFQAVLIPPDGNLDCVIDAANEAALICAHERLVFCPPIATFHHADNAKFENIASGLGLKVDLDTGDTSAKLLLLKRVLGRATVVVESGGVTETGHAKLHAYWRLAVPTANAEQHDQLRSVGKMAAHLAGGDPSAASPVHPIRWAGALHQKGQPRLARIIELNEKVEIDPGEAEPRLREAIEAIDGPGYFTPKSDYTGSSTDTPSIEVLRDAMTFVPNHDLDWVLWNDMGMAIYAATGGSQEGLESFVTWSSQSDKHDEDVCRERWKHFRRSPPTKIGFGKIEKVARASGWRGPNLLSGFTLQLPPDGKVIPPPPPANTRPPGLLQTSASGVPHSNLTNAFAVIGSAIGFRDSFAYDELRAMTVWMPEREPVTAVGAGHVQEILQRQFGLTKISLETVLQAIEMIAKQAAFNPFVDYLDGLVWDGIPRLDRHLIEHAGAEDNQYCARIFSMFVIGMVARGYQPGCILDYMLVLEGPQGARKSTFCRILGGAWYGDSLPDIASKDASIALRAKILIEVSEMFALSRAEVTALKSFITRREERFRPPYGRQEIIEPRRCCFIGTTNERTYLKDPTGARRFWPIKVGPIIDTDALVRDRDQLFAEAVHRYRQGEAWWPDGDFEAAVIRPEQEARYEADIWTDAIEAFVRERAEVTVAQVAGWALNLSLDKIGTADQRRIAAALESMGWARSHRGSHGERFWRRVGAGGPGT